MGWTRETVKRRLVERFYARFHMSLILASSALAAMVTNWALLQVGMGSMLARYPLAIAMAYLTFLGCVGLWLRYVGAHRGGDTRRSRLDAQGLGDLPVGSGSGGSASPGVSLPRGGGGAFDGGGATASWAEGAQGASGVRVPAALAVGDGEAAGAGDALRELAGGADGDLVPIASATGVVVAIMAASGYLLWMAPDILTEAAFGALLAGTLAKRSQREERGGWVSGVVRKTWWPFATVLVVAVVFAAYCASNYPAARTFREAFALAFG